MKYLQKVLLLTISLLSTSILFGQQKPALAEFDCNTVSEIPISECEALVSLYNSTNGESWSNNDGWLISNTPCGWHGINCFGGYVIELYLVGNQLTGSIPSELGNLTNLRDLYLSDNQLTGSIPSELANLPGLYFLSLSANQLTGSIPSELGNLPNLAWISLSSNQLTGSIPSELGNLTNLRTLFLGSNQLTGGIPVWLGDLTNLSWLGLNDNELMGAISKELMKLGNLISIDICNNHLYTNNPDLRNFLNAKQEGGNWESCQTPPFFIPLSGILQLLLF